MSIEQNAKVSLLANVKTNYILLVEEWEKK
jgi:hypothetical protein